MESVRVLIPSITKGFEWQTARIDAFVESMDDLMVVAQIKNILEQNSVNRPRLEEYKDILECAVEIFNTWVPFKKD